MRYLFTLAMTVSLLALEASCQEKKEKPKGLPRIAVKQSVGSRQGPRFRHPGEYAGETKKGAKVGVQVVARGAGNFYVRVLDGGLPGAGWDGKSKTEGAATTVDGKVKLDKGLEGSIADGVLTLGDSPLKRVERKSPTLEAKAPAEAVVLFGGPEDVEKWSDAQVVELSDGKFLACKPGKNILSKAAFKNFKVHLEFRLPWMPNSSGQGRGNSGLYLQNRYELQMLDSFGLKGENNECGGFYTQYAPLVNMCLPPLVWQTYDIDFTAAEFADGKVSKPAHTTVGPQWREDPGQRRPERPNPGRTERRGQAGPFHLQWHGDPMVYRNIWVVEMK